MKSEIEAAVRGTINFHFTFNPFLGLMPLSPQDKMEIAETFEVDSSKVEKLKHSILLKSDDTFWKYIPSTSEFLDFVLFLKNMEGAKPKHITLPSGTVKHEDLMFSKENGKILASAKIHQIQSSKFCAIRFVYH